MSWLFNCLAVWRAGGHAIRITSRKKLNDQTLDGLIIGGGDDISAELYGGKIEFNVRVDSERDALEQRMLSKALDQGIPVMGICRGSQMINIQLSGNLHTDIYKVFKEAPRLRTILPRKRVTIEKPSKLFGILRNKRFRINCLHHQSIDQLGQGLKVVAKDDFGIIQAIESTQHPFPDRGAMAP